MEGRKNAMLTTEDRRWLVGEKSYEGEYAKQQRYQRRREIRERIRNSILDFSLLVEHLEPAEAEKLFSPVPDPPTGEDEFTDGLRDALVFVLLHTGIVEHMTADGSDDGAQEIAVAEWLLEEALYRAGRREDILVESVELEVEATPVPALSLLDDIDDGRVLSPAAIRLLLDHEKVDRAEIQSHIRAMILEGAHEG